MKTEEQSGGWKRLSVVITVEALQNLKNYQETHNIDTRDQAIDQILRKLNI